MTRDSGQNIAHQFLSIKPADGRHMPSKILVVDDAPLNRRILTSLLQPEGYVLLEAGNGREAVDLALRELPDLIMLDISMPLMNGYEACSLLKQNTDSKNIPIIFISCIHDESFKIKCLELGIADYITKPFNKAEVCIRVRNQIQLYQMTQALRTAHQQLCDKQQRLDEDLRSAAIIQQSLILKHVPYLPYVQVAWQYIPCERVGGDIFNIHQLDETHLAMFMLDVSGHGVSSAMVTVSVSQSLTPQLGHLLKKRQPLPPYYAITPPAGVLRALDEEYPFERFGKYFTLSYLVLDCRYGQLRYSSAAHPPPLLLRQSGEVVKLREGGAIIGLGGVVPFAEGAVQLYPGDRLVLYTDGVLDCVNSHDESFGEERFVNTVVAWHGTPVDTMCDRLIQTLFAHGGGVSPQDDISVLALEYQGGVAANGT
jgi:phosphoserine phosphatase RsbU/P